jgi:hypothetical protein
MKRVLAVCAAAVVAILAPALLTNPASASQPETATISYANPSQVFVQSQPMQGGMRAGFVQTICNTQTSACDPVTFTVDPTRGGAIDHNAVLTIDFKPASPNMMALAQYPPGCPEDTNPTGACATYFQTASPYVFPDPGRTELRLKVVCQVCVNGTYQLTASLAHVVPPDKLPPIGNTSPSFAHLQLPDPTPPPGLGGQAPGQLTSQFGEPGIWINHNGYGIVNTFGPTIWITKDGGKTFSDPYDLIQNDTVCQSKYAGDADAIVGIDNTFYADNLCLGTVGGVNNESFSNSSGGDPGSNGSNWSSGTLAGGASDRQWYVVDPKDPKTLYISFHGFQTPDINVFKSTDGGATFFCPITGVPVTPATSTVDCPVTATSNGTPPVNTTYLDTGLGNVTTRPMIDPNDPNTIYVPYADTVAAHAGTAPANRGDNDLTRFRMAVSHDGGKSWAANSDPTGQGVAFDSEDGRYFPVTNTSATDGTNDSTIAHIFIGATIDTGGNLYILFSLRLGTGTATHLYMMSSTDKGATWSAPHQVDSGVLNSNVFPTMIAGSPGRIAMAWYGSTSTDFNDTGAVWSEMYSESVNALDAHPVFTQSRISDSTPVHAADICQAGTFCLITGGNRNLADFQTVAIDPCGYPVIVYTDDHAPIAHTEIARQTAGNGLYANTPAGCAGAAATNVVPVPSTTNPNTSPAAAGGAPSAAAAQVGIPNTSSSAPASTGWLLPGLALLSSGLLWRRRRGPRR